MGRSLRFNKNSQNITSSTEEGVKSKSPKCTSESTYSFTDNEKAQATACLALGKKKKTHRKLRGSPYSVRDTTVCTQLGKSIMGCSEES